MEIFINNNIYLKIMLLDQLFFLFIWTCFIISLIIIFNNIKLKIEKKDYIPILIIILIAVSLGVISFNYLRSIESSVALTSAACLSSELKYNIHYSVCPLGLVENGYPALISFFFTIFGIHIIIPIIITFVITTLSFLILYFFLLNFFSKLNSLLIVIMLEISLNNIAILFSLLKETLYYFCLMLMLLFILNWDKLKSNMSYFALGIFFAFSCSVRIQFIFIYPLIILLIFFENKEKLDPNKLFLKFFLFLIPLIIIFLNPYNIIKSFYTNSIRVFIMILFLSPIWLFIIFQKNKRHNLKVTFIKLIFFIIPLIIIITSTINIIHNDDLIKYTSSTFFKNLNSENLNLHKIILFLNRIMNSYFLTIFAICLLIILFKKRIILESDKSTKRILFFLAYYTIIITHVINIYVSDFMTYIVIIHHNTIQISTTFWLFFLIILNLIITNFLEQKKLNIFFMIMIIIFISGNIIFETINYNKYNVQPKLIGISQKSGLVGTVKYYEHLNKIVNQENYSDKNICYHEYVYNHRNIHYLLISEQNNNVFGLFNPGDESCIFENCNSNIIISSPEKMNEFEKIVKKCNILNCTIVLKDLYEKYDVQNIDIIFSNKTLSYIQSIKKCNMTRRDYDDISVISTS